jgi:hypothetical protein
MVPEALTRIFEQYDYEDLRLCIIRVDFQSDIFRFDIEIKAEENGHQDPLGEQWTVTAIGIREQRISLNFAENIMLKEDHPLLWTFHDTQCQLYFAGTCRDPAGLFLEMYHIHRRLYENYVLFEDSLNLTDFTRLFQLKGGLVSKGPRKLMSKYAEALTAFGLDFSIIGDWIPTIWNGEARVPERKDLKLLLMQQTKTYIIAEDFVFTKIEPGARPPTA